MMKRKVSLNLDDAVLTELEKMAEKSGRKLSPLINDILKGGLSSRAEMLKEVETINLLDLVKKMKAVMKSGLK